VQEAGFRTETGVDWNQAPTEDRGFPRNWPTDGTDMDSTQCRVPEAPEVAGHLQAAILVGTGQGKQPRGAVRVAGNCTGWFRFRAQRLRTKLMHGHQVPGARLSALVP
jgi:hypothetical protein